MEVKTLFCEKCGSIMLPRYKTGPFFWCDGFSTAVYPQIKECVSFWFDSKSEKIKNAELNIKNNEKFGIYGGKCEYFVYNCSVCGYKKTGEPQNLNVCVLKEETKQIRKEKLELAKKELIGLRQMKDRR